MYLWQSCLLLTVLGGVVQVAGNRSAAVDKSGDVSKDSSSRIVRFTAGTTESGELFTPLRGKPGAAPGIVLITDSPGIDDCIRSEAKRLAAKGYLTLVVDPNQDSTKVGNSGGTSPADSLRIIDGAVGFLQNWIMNPEDIGLIGWGTGGTLAMQLAASGDHVRAAINNFGEIPRDSQGEPHARMAIMANVVVGKSAEEASRLTHYRKALEAAKTPVDIKTFGRTETVCSVVLDAAEKTAGNDEVESRMFAFLARYLKQ